ncbi:ER membrane protein complex subunit 8/9 homolog [Aegilops tauschii subsp. strangulata]|uniref:MPN domain-containing protein n=1 Tax=Aegilops tauschii subsp. strangulata TaxID=200361 RepID=A0A452XF64_AEGTS|nr:ER membrane protein complex subunit 8/9 homolog [Aegilops tauschii subsp. strangulata]
MGVECRYELAQAAYVKLALHALKHPAAAVNGLLVGRLADPAASPAVVSVADAVPLSHQPHHLPLLPTLELALTLVEDHFQAQGLAVVGYYHANARRDDADLPAVAKRVGDHIFRYFPRAAVLLLDNVKLEEVVKGSSRDAVVQLYTRDSSKSWRQAGSDGSSQLKLKEPSTNVVLADHVTTKKWQKVVDFDDHLDDISKDWLNASLLG